MIFLLSIPLLVGPIIFLCLVAYGYAVKASVAERRANRAEGALDESRGYAEKMRDLAAQAIQAAKEKHFPVESRGDYGNTNLTLPQVRYIAPEVAFCPRCNVSVRHDPGQYPVPCPACSTLIDPVLDNPPEL